MPNLTALARRGVTFQNHHSVFPTVTRVNMASIQTGCYPGTHGLAGNNLLVREFEPARQLTLNGPDLTSVRDATGEMILKPTLGELLADMGLRYAAVGIGGTGNAFMQNPYAAETGGASIHYKFTTPARLHDEIVARFGPWPPGPDLDVGTMKETIGGLMGRAVEVLTDYVIEETAPAVSLLWCSEPDASQHRFGVGSRKAETAIREADEQFGCLIEWLDRTGRTSETDVLVLSDHGYSSVGSTVNVAEAVKNAGFAPAAGAGGVVVVPNGGAVLFYVHEHDVPTADRLAEFLMRQSWCGPLFASDAVGEIEGTLPLSAIGAEGRRAPDLAMSSMWEPRPNSEGWPGHIVSTNDLAADHGSLSPSEVRNVLVAAGPSFKAGATVASPSSNVDIAPTVFRLLGVPSGTSMDGRPLDEALVGGTPVEWSTQHLEARRRLPGATYHQKCSVSTAAGSDYPDFGTATHG